MGRRPRLINVLNVLQNSSLVWSSDVVISCAVACYKQHKG